jgi:hypothetical protein
VLIDSTNRGADEAGFLEYFGYRCREYLDCIEGALLYILCHFYNIQLCEQDTQERTRKRIKEDLRASSQAYTDYAENTLPKLKRTYLRKCQDVEDHKAAVQAQTPHPRQEGGQQPQSHSPEHYNAPLTNSKSNPSLPTKPVVTSPHPLRPLDRRPSGSMPTTRNRSPSANTPFSDLASHGKLTVHLLLPLTHRMQN